jgi:hypothetical protein
MMIIELGCSMPAKRSNSVRHGRKEARVSEQLTDPKKCHLYSSRAGSYSVKPVHLSSHINYVEECGGAHILQSISLRSETYLGSGY